MRGLWPSLRDAWHLALPYFRSEERWSARLLLGSVIGLSLVLVQLNVTLNYWNGALYDALQNKDAASFVALLLWGQETDTGFLLGFLPIVALLIPASIYRSYLQQWLEIRWRRWLTVRMTARWLSDRAYYRISLDPGQDGTGTDNPDQRIAEDVRDFVRTSLTLSLGVLSNGVNIYKFTIILWGLSGAVTLAGYHIPGYMVWVALVYSVIATIITHLVGRRLTLLNFNQQRYEADFRFALVRLRENTEGVALSGGEAEESRTLAVRFGQIVANWWRIMGRQKLLNAMTAGIGQAANVFPLVVAAPRYFAGEIMLGPMMRVVDAFGNVQGSMSWFVDNYALFASWRSMVERLSTFSRALDGAKAVVGQGVLLEPGRELALHQVTLRLPDGATLLRADGLHLPQGRSTLIRGRSGSGKSTLFRALAGIWPFGEGRVERPAGTYLFLPQRPYVPLGTLRHAIAYPSNPDEYGDDRIREALHDSGLGRLDDELYLDKPWSQRLSGGEQQRLALARALLMRPDWLFLDEATASLDPQGEAELYNAIKLKMPGTTVVSIAHRPAVAAFHDQVVVLDRDADGLGHLEPGQLEAAPS